MYDCTDLPQMIVNFLCFKISIGQTAYSVHVPTIPVPLSMPSPTVQCYPLIGSSELFKEQVVVVHTMHIYVL